MQNEVTTPRHHQPTSPNHHRTPPDPRIRLDPEKTVDIFLENDQIHVMSNRKKHPKIEIHSKKPNPVKNPLQTRIVLQKAKLLTISKNKVMSTIRDQIIILKLVPQYETHLSLSSVAKSCLRSGDQPQAFRKR
jgi:hypothetical protein